MITVKVMKVLAKEKRRKEVVYEPSNSLVMAGIWWWVFFSFILFYSLKNSVIFMILMESDQCCAPSQHYDQNAKTIFDSRDLQQLTFPTYFPAVASFPILLHIFHQRNSDWQLIWTN